MYEYCRLIEGLEKKLLHISSVKRFGDWQSAAFQQHLNSVS